MIETAKQNGLNPYAYLNWLFTRTPEITDDAEWEELLPQNLNIDQINNAPFAGVREN